MKKIEPVHVVLVILGLLALGFGVLVLVMLFVHTPLILLTFVAIASVPYILAKLWNTYIATEDEYYD